MRLGARRREGGYAACRALARESAEAFEIGLFVGWAAGALRFPNGFGQAFDHHVLGFVRMAA